MRLSNVSPALVLVSALAAISACSAAPSSSSSAEGEEEGAGGGSPLGPLPGIPGAPAVGEPLPAGTTDVADFGENPGNLTMRVHSPPSPASAPAIVVALHGCTQTAEAYEAAGWNELADARGFYVIYPQQSSANNMNRCFRWFEPGHTARGQGEPASIVAMVEAVRARTGASRAFVTGLSAGGAMTAVMLATYPDVFEAGAVMSGVPYKCASGMVDAFSCMSPGRSKAGSAWGDLVRAAGEGGKARLQVWHGDADYTVRPMNAGELAKQWANVHGAADKPSATETVGRATRKSWVDASGTKVVEVFTVPGMGHGTPVDPKGGCGKAGAYVLDTGLCSSAYAADFFGL